MDHAEVLALRELLAADTWIALDKIYRLFDDGTLFDVFFNFIGEWVEDSSTVMRMPWGRNQPAIVFVIASLSDLQPILSDLFCGRRVWHSLNLFFLPQSVNT